MDFKLNRRTLQLFMLAVHSARNGDREVQIDGIRGHTSRAAALRSYQREAAAIACRRL